jgi:hypothetical protein
VLDAHVGGYHEVSWTILYLPGIDSCPTDELGSRSEVEIAPQKRRP